MSTPTARRGGGVGRPAAEVLEDLEIVRRQLGPDATWAELAAELGMTRAALTRAVERARRRGVSVAPTTPSPRGWAAWGKQYYHGA